MMKKEQRKLVTFDLDTEALKVYYPKTNWRKAYYVIRKHMISNGFEWLQYSVYVSKNKMSVVAVNNLIKDLINSNTWLNRCMRDCKLTELGEDFNLNVLFDKTLNIPTREKLERLERDGEDNDLVREMEELEYRVSKLSILLGSKEIER